MRTPRRRAKRVTDRAARDAAIRVPNGPKGARGVRVRRGTITQRRDNPALTTVRHGVDCAAPGWSAGASLGDGHRSRAAPSR